jgi:hypothetical protein
MQQLHIPVPPLLRTWHAFAVKMLFKQRATTVTLNLLECSLSFDKTLGFGERHRVFGLAHLADIVQGGGGTGSDVSIVFHTPQSAQSDGTVPSTLHVPTGLFEDEDSTNGQGNGSGGERSVAEGDPAFAGIGGGPLSLAAQTQNAVAINAPGPAGVGSATHYSVYKKVLTFAGGPLEALEFVDLVSSVRLTGASVGVIAAASGTAALKGNPAVLLFLELDERRQGAIGLEALRRGLQRVLVGELGAEAAAKASAGAPSAEHPWVAQLTSGMRSCTLSRFIILYGRLLTLINTPSAAASLLGGATVNGAFKAQMSSLTRRELHADFVPTAPAVPPMLLAGEELLEQQPRSWMLVDSSALVGGGGSSSVEGPASAAAGASSNSSAGGGPSSNVSGGGQSGPLRVRGCFFLTDYRIIFVPSQHPNLDADGELDGSSSSSQPEHVEMALGALARVEQLSKDESLSSFVLAFHSKDLLRVLHLGFDAPRAWVDLIAKIVPGLAFPHNKDQTKLFAFTHHQKKKQNNGKASGASGGNNNSNNNEESSLPPEMDGWNLLDPLREYARTGLVDENGNEIHGRGFRLSYFNIDFESCPSYPRVVCVVRLHTSMFGARDSSFSFQCAMLTVSLSAPVVFVICRAARVRDRRRVAERGKIPFERSFARSSVASPAYGCQFESLFAAVVGHEGQALRGRREIDHGDSEGQPHELLFVVRHGCASAQGGGGEPTHGQRSGECQRLPRDQRAVPGN